MRRLSKCRWRRALALLAVLVMPAFAATQQAKMERRVIARTFELRGALLEACMDAKPDRLREVTEACRGIGRLAPLVSYTSALMAARGIEVDDAARFRGGLVAFVVPEIVDQAKFQEIYVTMRLFRKRDEVAPVRFVVRLLDGAGDSVRQIEIDEGTSIDGLLRVAARGSIPVGDLDDGRYRIEVETLLGDESPIDGQPKFATEVIIDRSYSGRIAKQPLYLDPFHPDAAARAEKVTAALDGLAARVPGAAGRAAWMDAMMRVYRPFRGEAPVVTTRALADLARLERITANLRDGEDPYAGMTGRLTIGVPVGESVGKTAKSLLETQYASVSVELLASNSGERPLVLFLPSAPSWDGGTDRPSGVKSEAPAWLWSELERMGFDAAGEFHTAIMESPGRMKSPLLALPKVVQYLQTILPVDGDRVVLVGDRGGAYCVSRALVAHPDLARGAVLVNGGALSNPDLEKLGDKHFMLVPSAGHPSEVHLESLQKRAEGRANAGMLEGADLRPWPIAVPLASRAIEGFVRAVVK